MSESAIIQPICSRRIKVEKTGLLSNAQYGDILGFVIAPLIAIAAWFAYVKLDDMSAKIGASIAAVLLNWAILYIAFAGIFSPILEIQKQLS